MVFLLEQDKLLDHAAKLGAWLKQRTRWFQGALQTVRERFDLLVERRAWFEPPMQKFLDFCRTDSFHSRASKQHGYDASGFGRVHFNGA